MRTRMTLAAASAMVGMLSSMASAQIFWNDDFESYTSGIDALTGQQVPGNGGTLAAGQTWGAFTLFGSYDSFNIADTNLGSNGAVQTTDAVGGNRLDLTAAPGSDKVYVDWDMITNGRSTNQPQWWFCESGNCISFTMDLPTQTQWQGNAVTTNKGVQPSIFGGGVDGGIHVAMVIDQVANTVDATYWDLADPGTVGTMPTADLVPGLAYTRIELFVNDTGQAQPYGYDNFRIASTPIPEPASMALLALGGLTMLRRRR